MPVVSGVADAAGELAAAGRATAAGVAASTEVKPRWGSSQVYWRTTAPTPPLRRSSIYLDCVRAVQNDELGLLDVVALGDERFDPRALDGEMVLGRVEERTQRHLLTVPECGGSDMRSDRRHVLHTVEACVVAGKAHIT